MPSPDAVDDDAGGERVFGVNDCVGEFEATGAVGERFGVDVVEEAEELALGCWAGACGISAAEDSGGDGFRAVVHDHGANGCVGGGCLVFVDAIFEASAGVAFLTVAQGIGIGEGEGGWAGGLKEDLEELVGVFVGEA